LKDRVGVHVSENRRFTNDELHEVFQCFMICPLRDCHSSTPIQENLCQIGSKNAHR
jgi:hypothetical protein